METKTHWKKAFKSDYLSSADIDEKELSLVIKNVVYKECITASGKKFCNVAIFTDGTKPMILNVGNSKIIKRFSGGKIHIEEWVNIPIKVYVDTKVKFGGDLVEGLRIRETQPLAQKPELLKSNVTVWANAVAYYRTNKVLTSVKERYTISEENEKLLIQEANVD